MRSVDVKKIIFLILVWLFVSYTATYASYNPSFQPTNGTHCDQQNLSMDHECCQNLVTTSHCNNCFQITLTLASDALLPLTDSDHQNIDRFNQLHHPEPLLELFKPPI